MPKALAIAGMAVSLIVLLIFGLDVAIGWPFGDATNSTWDFIFVVCAVILTYMSFTTFREQR